MSGEKVGAAPSSDNIRRKSGRGKKIGAGTAVDFLMKGAMLTLIQIPSPLTRLVQRKLVVQRNH